MAKPCLCRKKVMFVGRRQREGGAGTTGERTNFLPPSLLLLTSSTTAIIISTLVFSFHFILVIYSFPSQVHLLYFCYVLIQFRGHPVSNFKARKCWRKPIILHLYLFLGVQNSLVSISVDPSLSQSLLSSSFSSLQPLKRWRTCIKVGRWLTDKNQQLENKLNCRTRLLPYFTAASSQA